jgi:FixJ family two-component response regulator
VPDIVCIIENDLREDVEELLKKEGFETEHFRSAEEFRQKRHHDTCSCLIVNVLVAQEVVFQLDELAAASAIVVRIAGAAGPKLHNPPAPVISVTRRGESPAPAAAAQGMKPGEVTFRDGPIDRHELVTSVRSALDIGAERAKLKAKVATLQPREHEIAQLAARGETNKEIAARLGVGQRTVSKCLHQATKKLGTSKRVDLKSIFDRIQ